MEIGINTVEPGSVAKPFQCTFCDRSFTRKPYLEEHILNKHVDDKEFQCTECFKTNQLVKSFATQHLLNKHIQRVHGPSHFKCTVCFKLFRDSANFANHKRSHSHRNIKRQKCALCSKAFLLNSVLQAHLFYVHKQRREGVHYFKCDVCAREFVKRSNLELHVIHEHVVDKPYKCLVCSKTFIDQRYLEKHIKGHDRQNEYFCDVCLQGFTLKNGLVNHLGVKHKRFFYCDKCLNSYKNKCNFDGHISDSKQEIKCNICQETINSECNFKIHRDSHLKEIKIETKDNKIENQIKPLEADTQITQTSTKGLNSEKFECELCSKTFDREAYFRAHRRNVHPLAEWKCNFQGCCKTFKAYNIFRLHKMMHAETKEFVCNICQKSFYRPDRLKNHEQVHMKNKKYKCEICPKSFTTRAGLRTHIANNHGGIKPFKCPVVKCGTFWASNSQLKVHLVSHQTEKSFRCEICQPFRAFKTLSQLKKHERQVHSVAKVLKALKSRKNLKNRKHSDAVIFMCSKDACSFKTDNEKDVALHHNEQHQLLKVVIFRCQA